MTWEVEYTWRAFGSYPWPPPMAVLTGMRWRRVFVWWDPRTWRRKWRTASADRKAGKR